MHDVTGGLRHRRPPPRPTPAPPRPPGASGDTHAVDGVGAGPPPPARTTARHHRDRRPPGSPDSPPRRCASTRSPRACSATRAVRVHFDRRVIVHERELVNGSRRRVRAVRTGHARQRRRQSRVIERRALLPRRRVDEHELIAALHRLAIPEARGPDPRRLLRDVHREPAQPLVDGRGASIVVDRSLCLDAERDQSRDRAEGAGPNESRRERVLYHLATVLGTHGCGGFCGDSALRTVDTRGLKTAKMSLGCGIVEFAAWRTKQVRRVCRPNEPPTYARNASACHGPEPHRYRLRGSRHGS